MKRSRIRYSMLLICFVALTATQAYAQGFERFIQLNSLSWGIAPGQTARVSVVQFAFGDGSVRSRDPIIARIQLLDSEGEVVAQSGEIRVEPGKIRFWDAAYEQISGVREPGTGRLQLRVRVLVTTRSFDVDRNQPPSATLEIFDSTTGATASMNPYITVDFIEVLPRQ